MKRVAWLCWLLSICAWAQGTRDFDPMKDVGLGLHNGKVVLTVPEGAHLKAAFLEIKLKPGNNGKLAVGPIPPALDKDELGDGVWHDNVAIPVRGANLRSPVELLVKYQPCTEGEGGVCYPPTTRSLVVRASSIPLLKAEVVPGKVDLPVPKPTPAAAPGHLTAKAMPSQPNRPETDRGLLWALLAVFLAGMATSLTPCVLPMIPITMAIIGARSTGKAAVSWTRGLALSLTLVLGMASTYTVLGVAAARTGAAFGAAAQKPAFLVPMAILFAVLAISLFGAFELSLPASWQAKLQGDGQRKGFLGAFVMGLVLGPISAPCVGPVLGAVLLKIAEKGDMLMGGIQLFTFALGMGVLFVVAGTSTAALPKSGDWLTRFKQMLGLVVLGFAAWSVRFIVPGWANLAMWSAVGLIGASVFGAFETAHGLVSGLFKSIGILSLALGVLLGIRAVESFENVPLLPKSGPGKAEAAPSIWLSQDLEGALARAKAEHKIVLVDIYASWCAQCHELDDKTWPDPALQQWIEQNAVAVRIDTDQARPDLAAKLKISSYPTVLMLDEDGHELKRILGFQKPESMLEFLRVH